MSKDAQVPVRAHADDAGYDLFSAVDAIIPPDQIAQIGTRIKIKIPPGCYGRIAPRSSLALNNSINVFGGVVDQGYSGEICVLLFNHGKKPFEVKKGARIAQLICEKIATPDIQVVTSPFAEDSERGSGGFGSSGV